MNLYHYYLDIPVKFEPVFLEPNFAHHNQYDLSLLSFEYIKWFNDLGLTIKFGELFTRHVGQPPVHAHLIQMMNIKFSNNNNNTQIVLLANLKVGSTK